jgi:hypothetical protein
LKADLVARIASRPGRRLKEDLFGRLKAELELGKAGQAVRLKGDLAVRLRASLAVTLQTGLRRARRKGEN